MRPSFLRRPDTALIAAASAQYPEADEARHRRMWSPPGGIKTDVPLSQVLPTESPNLVNLRVYHNQYQVRPGIVRVGTALADPVLTATVFVTSRNDEIIYALTTKGIYELAGNTWVQLTGPELTTSLYAQYSLSAWNDKMLVANGFDKLLEVDNETRTYQEIADSPRARYVTTFAGRPILGYVEGSPSRIQWSVRNNDHDWTGLGSGYEDLLSTPGGVVDSVRGIFPISDIDAIVVRTRTIWLMRQTGNYLSPFSFTELWNTTGTIAPWSLTLTPAGLIGLFRDNVYMISPSEPPTPIGDAIRDSIIDVTGMDYASGCFDAWNQEYCLSIPEESCTNVWRYKLVGERKTWTRDTYSFPSRRMHSQIYRNAVAIEDLPGTMDELPGSFETLGLTNQRRGLMFATGQSSQTVMRESPESVVDQNADETKVDSGVAIDLWSGQVSVTSTLKKVDLVELLVEYRCSRQVLLWLELSEDGGDSWTVVTQETTRIVHHTEMMRFFANRSTHRMMLRLRSNDAAGFELVAAYPRLSEGGDIAY